MKKGIKLAIILLSSLMVFSGLVFAQANDMLNIIGNGDFTKELSLNQPDEEGFVDTKGSWVLHTNSGGIVKGYLENGAFKAEVTDAGQQEHSIQLMQGPVNLERGKKYQITFDARSDSNNGIVIKLGADARRSWTAYIQDNKTLSTEMKTYQVEFVMGQKTDENTRFEIWLLNEGNYWIDNIVLKETGQVEMVAEGTKTEADEDKVENWELVWSEEFNSSEINTDIWNFQLGNGPDWNQDGSPDAWGNEEAEYYTEDNAYIENGKLVIEAREETRIDMGKRLHYTSARLNTKDKYTFKYGRIEVRAKLPEGGQGIWPAIWLLGSNEDTAIWPACGEIDIMEYLGHEPNIIHGTSHGPVSAGPGIGHKYELPLGEKFSDKYHDFILEWDEDELEFYVDDVLYHVVNKHEAGEADWVFDHDFYMLLNLAVGGSWPGYPDETTPFPQTMKVDYVRYYQDTDPRTIDDEKWDSEYEEMY
ncbi:family 16 glycosylhydrolase [Iocasia frigidifontis]|uniref:Family 16 glycosylhydrolase n=1 Tax=Iocasia fonsfrigidae TaxID=2682810 RepID=A0A8A7KMV9_9FIRM|nr:family 16 glycosylhydrolase [Iocasia fonsfrigidae]QTL99182.1 family 16 glycosylhydrolase [Iocasia fonsfrigidae]